MNVTFVIPLFNERETLAPLVEGITAHVAPHAHRILFVDDGSTDGSFEVLQGLHARYDTVDVIRFRRNLGKAAALAAGFARADGDIVFTMDADLQDDPREIPNFLRKLDEGFDLVCGWKKTRRDPWHKTAPSRIYNAAVSRLFHLDLHDVNCGYKAFRGEVVARLAVYGDLHRLIPVLAANLGYRLAEIPVEHHPRRHGVSKYGIERFLRGAMDVVTMLFLSRYASRPGHFFGKIGCLSWMLAGAGALGACAAWGLARTPVPGLALMILATGLFVCGAGAIGLGQLGELMVHQKGSADLTPWIADEMLHSRKDRT